MRPVAQMSASLPLTNAPTPQAASPKDIQFGLGDYRDSRHDRYDRDRDRYGRDHRDDRRDRDSDDDREISTKRLMELITGADRSLLDIKRTLDTTADNHLKTAEDTLTKLHAYDKYDKTDDVKKEINTANTAVQAFKRQYNAADRDFNYLERDIIALYKDLKELDKDDDQLKKTKASGLSKVIFTVPVALISALGGKKVIQQKAYDIQKDD